MGGRESGEGAKGGYTALLHFTMIFKIHSRVGRLEIFVVDLSTFDEEYLKGKKTLYCHDLGNELSRVLYVADDK